MKFAAVTIAVLALAATVMAVPVNLRHQNELDATEQAVKPESEAATAVLAEVTRTDDPSKPREPQWAVTFMTNYDADLPLPEDRLKAKRALLGSDPFLFYRATPAVFHSDAALAKGHKERFLLNPRRQSPTITIGGDIHLANFGSFRGPTGDAVFGVNDYDQSGNGVADADLTRLATSAVLAARALKMPEIQQSALVAALGKEYFKELAELEKETKPRAAYLTEEKAKGVVKTLVEKATKQKRGDFLDKYSKSTSKTTRVFTRGAELIDVAPATVQRVKNVLSSYRVLDVIEKLNSGGSSFGLPRFWALVANPKPDKEPLLIELKWLLPPALKRGNHKAEGKVLVLAQKALGGYHNPITSATDLMDDKRAWYLIREVEPEKDSVKLDKLKPADLTTYVEQCAKVLARAHTGGAIADQQKKAGALNKWIGAAEVPAALTRLTVFAMKYAEQVAHDHAAFKATHGV